MMRRILPCGLVLACSFLIVASRPASADDKKDKPALSGVWTLKGGETKMDFSAKKVLKIFPHGDNDVIVIVCEYTADKKGLVKAKVSDIEGKEEAKKIVMEMLPVGTEFSFKWKVTDDAAKLDEVKGEKADGLKSHLEGDYNQKK